MPLSPQELRRRVVKTAPSAPAMKVLSEAAPTALNTKALLHAANSASEQAAGLHIAFMAVCAYVLVIVFGTTDRDLLIGGNIIKLPLIDVAVPLVGFYAIAPYLVVLMHLNLLLQLQLLSRKLFAFDNTALAEKDGERLRDQLHMFPYTYYLMCHPDVVVKDLLGLVVSVTLVMLPLATLLSLQLKFLAYQAEAVTWVQRLAVFLDVGLLFALWPVILHPRDDRKAWWQETLTAHLRRKWAGLAVIVLIVSLLLILFAATRALFTVGLTLGAAAPLLLTWLNGSVPRKWQLCAIAVLWVLSTVLGVLVWDPANASPSLHPAIPMIVFLGMLPLACFWRPSAPCGSLALLSALVLAPLLTLGLMVDGERWEVEIVAKQKSLRDWVLSKSESAEEQGQSLAQQFEKDHCLPFDHSVLSCVILAEQRRLDLEEQALFTNPPTPERRAALRTGKGLENLDTPERSISLKDRSLRHARMISTQLVLADLRGAQLQGADLSWAELQGAWLNKARLQGTKLEGVHLQSVDLGEAQLQGAYLKKAWLEKAQLQGANLKEAQLQGANLKEAELQGANLKEAQLQEADLSQAQLQGAYLKKAWLQGARLSGAHLQDADLSDAQLQGADLSQAQLQGADLKTQQRDEFVKRHEALATLSCKDTRIARGILSQISEQETDPNSTRAGLVTVLCKRMKQMNANNSCPGLANLPTDDKTTLAARCPSGAFGYPG